MPETRLRAAEIRYPRGRAYTGSGQGDGALRVGQQFDGILYLFINGHLPISPFL
jgi:hypothetical protein